MKIILGNIVENHSKWIYFGTNINYIFLKLSPGKTKRTTHEASDTSQCGSQQTRWWLQFFPAHEFSALQILSISRWEFLPDCWQRDLGCWACSCHCSRWGLRRNCCCARWCLGRNCCSCAYWNWKPVSVQDGPVRACFSSEFPAWWFYNWVEISISNCFLYHNKDDPIKEKIIQKAAVWRSC